ncbi:hypothetical protein [Haloferax sp. ATB1]|uniref:hypothetical protein n=1 Tax=Haloferax sp. ATB1 TaxID=1508454 RepID=UPI000FE14310|nr:hypothetical protein [Haloferax sp. ATB1]
MRRRTHPRHRSRWPAVLGVVIVVLVGASVVPSSSFTATQVDRGATFSVVADSQAILGLDVPPTVTVNRTTRLVTVTNDLGTDVSVEVVLRADSTDKGDLVIDNTTVGDTAGISLSTGESQAVYIDVVSDPTLDGEQIYFGVNASGTGLTVTAPDRSVSITT